MFFVQIGWLLWQNGIKMTIIIQFLPLFCSCVCHLVQTSKQKFHFSALLFPALQKQPIKSRCLILLSIIWAPQMRTFSLMCGRGRTPSLPACRILSRRPRWSPSNLERVSNSPLTSDPWTDRTSRPTGADLWDSCFKEFTSVSLWKYCKVQIFLYFIDVFYHSKVFL